ncbi:MAG: NAD(P)H-dependent oxidoreductase [Oceanospirillaceae bacterium]|nr:NAD(P)H-dependent oxidoreductase [Oceanospirillaceae bacterium]
MKSKNSVLKVNSSSRFADSISRQVTQLISDRLLSVDADLTLIDRDLTTGVNFITEDWIGANFTDVSERSAEQTAVLADSTELVDELFAAQYLVIGAPMYNFSIPALLKAWFDQIARAKLTFEYTDTGPRGLVEGVKAYVVIASGGVTVGSEYDFSSKYVQQVLGFIGISDVTIIDASKIDLAAGDAVIQQQLSAVIGLEKAA